MGKLGREAIEDTENVLGEDKTEEEKVEKIEEVNQLKVDVELKLVTLASLSGGDLSGEKHGQALGTLGVVEHLLKQYMESNSRAMGLMRRMKRGKQCWREHNIL